MTLRVSLRFSPDNALPVGEISDNGRDTAFEYRQSFLTLGMNPAPFRLPFRPGVSVFDWSGGMETFGMFEDSLPDGWGRRLVDTAFRRMYGRPPSVLERLACVGANGIGTHFSFCPQSFPVSGSFPIKLVVCIRWSKYWLRGSVGTDQLAERCYSRG